MKKGYEAELGSRESEFEKLKSVLEGLYMMNQTEDEIQNTPDLKSKFDKAFNDLDGHVLSYAGTVRSVKMAVATRYESSGNTLYT